MKNSPDRPFNDKFEKRIASYSEIPDDVVWKNIDNALRPNRMLVLMAWWDRATGAAFILLLLGIAFASSQNDSQEDEYSHSVINQPIGNTPKKLSTDKKREARDSVPGRSMDPGKKDNTNIQIPDLSLKQFIVGENVGPNFAPNDSSKMRKGVVSGVRSLEPAEVLIEQPSIDSLSHAEIVEKTASEKAEEETSSKRLLNKLKIFVAATPMLNFHKVVPIAGDGIGITGVESSSVLSSDRLSISFSAGLQGYISPRLEYYGGITFFHKRTLMRYSLLSEEIVMEVDPGSMYSITPKHSVIEVESSTNNFGLQGGVLFHLYGKILMHKIGAGLLYDNSFGNFSSEEIYKPYRSSHLSYQLFYRNEIVINRRLKFFVQPTFTNAFYVDEKLNGRPFKLKPYSAGIGFGAIFQLD